MENKKPDYERMWRKLEETLTTKKSDLEEKAKYYFEIDCALVALDNKAIAYGYQMALEAMANVEAEEEEDQ